jgi:hypothetical protein
MAEVSYDFPWYLKGSADLCCVMLSFLRMSFPFQCPQPSCNLVYKLCN